VARIADRLKFILLVNVARFFLHIIHQQILAEGVGSGEIRFAPTEFRHFLHEVDEAVVARQHKRVDQNSGFSAAAHFFQCLRDDERIETKRVL